MHFLSPPTQRLRKRLILDKIVSLRRWWLQHRNYYHSFGYIDTKYWFNHEPGLNNWTFYHFSYFNRSVRCRKKSRRLHVNMTNTNNLYNLLSNIVTNFSLISNLTVVNCCVLLYSNFDQLLWKKRIERNLKRVNLIIFCLHFCLLIRILHWIALLRALL